MHKHDRAPLRARGLVVWTPDRRGGAASLAELADPAFHKIAIANPRRRVCRAQEGREAGVWL